METAVIYYSFTGHTKKLAEETAQKENAQLFALIETKPHSKIGAFVFGAYKAIKGKKTQLNPIAIPWENFSKIIIMMPIWGGSPAPAFNNLVEMLPPKKEVVLIMVSGGGDSQKGAQRSIGAIVDRDCELVDYKDLKA